MQFVRIEAASRGRWEIRKMCLAFSSVPPHFPFGFQMKCHVSLPGLQLLFSDSCPNAQRISFCCFYYSPYLYNLIHSHPFSYHVYLQSRWQTALPGVFTAVSWTPPPEVCSLSQVNRSIAKLSCFLLDLCLPPPAFHLWKEHHLLSDGSRQKLGHCLWSLPFL